MGDETVPGTAVAADRLLQAIGFQPTPSIPGTTFRPFGQLWASSVLLQKERSEGPMEGQWDYNSLVYPFSGIITSTTPSTPAGATNARLWVFTPLNNAPNTLKTFTVERGSSTAGTGARMVNAIINSMTMRLTETESAITGQMVGKKLVDGITLTASPSIIDARVVNPVQVTAFMGSGSGNEVQTLTLGAPSAGNWTISWQAPWASAASTTANIAFNAANSAVLTAMETVWGTGNFTVTGAAGGPYTVTYIGEFAGYNVAQATVNGAGLTGGSVTQATTTQGGLAKLTRLHEFEFGLDGRQTVGYTIDSAEESWTYAVERPPDTTLRFVVQHDSVSQGFKANMVAGDNLIFRLYARGALIETGFNYFFEATIPFLFSSVAIADRNDVQAATYQATPVYNSSLGYPLRFRVQNVVAAL